MKPKRMHNAIWYKLSAGHYSHIAGGTIKLLKDKTWHAYHNGHSAILTTRRAAKQFVEKVSAAQTPNKHGAVRAK